MKITIEVEDFYLDGEELEQGLTDQVKRHVLTEIQKSIDKKIESYLTTEIKKQVEDSMYKQMNLKISELMSTGMVKSYNDSNKTVTLEEYIKERFTKDSGWSSPREILERLAKNFGDDMKKRYDLLFASQIVAKLHETGMLKPDVAKLLLDTIK